MTMKKTSIKRKIALYLCILTSMSLAILTVAIYILFFETLRKNETNYIIESTSKTKHNIESVLKLVDNVGTLLGTNKELFKELNKAHWLQQSKPNNTYSSISSFLKNIISVQEYINAIYIIGSNNEFYSSNSGVNKDELMQRYGISLHEVPSPSRFYLGSHQTAYQTLAKPYVISYIRPLFDLNSKSFLGVIIIDINYDYLKEIFTISSIQNNQKVLVVTKEGEEILSFPYNIELNDIVKNNPELLTLEKARLNRKVFGQDSIIVSETIDYSDWKIINVISTAKIYKDISIVKNVALSVFILFILISISASVILSHNLTKPISELNEKIKLVENGNLDVNVKVKSYDELGKLSQSFNNMVIKLKELLNKVVDEQKKKSDLEFKMLQAQINPHFLYNTLDSIKWLAVIQNVDNIRDMSTSLINLLKYNISRISSLVSLVEEIESVKNYAQIQKYRYGDMFTVNYNLDKETLNCKVLRLILQPIVENSIFHGFENLDRKGIISITSYIDDNKLVIQIVDNGIGTDTKNHLTYNHNSKKKFSSIGLKNIEDRIKLYFGEGYGVKFKSKVGFGTKVTLTLPVICEDIKD